jgi:transketolase
VVFSPTDPVEAKLAAEYSLKAKEPVYVRLAKRGEPRIHKREKFDITQPQEIQPGKDLAIIFHGSVSTEALGAAEILKKDGIVAQLISLPRVQPLDTEKLFSLLEGVKYVLSVEEHFLGCGLGSILLKEHARLSPRWELSVLGITDKFIHEIKDTAGMREHFGISAKKIAASARALLKRKA